MAQSRQWHGLWIAAAILATIGFVGSSAASVVQANGNSPQGPGFAGGHDLASSGSGSFYPVSTLKGTTPWATLAKDQRSRCLQNSTNLNQTNATNLSALSNSSGNLILTSVLEVHSNSTKACTATATTRPNFGTLEVITNESSGSVVSILLADIVSHSPGSNPFAKFEVYYIPIVGTTVRTTLAFKFACATPNGTNCTIVKNWGKGTTSSIDAATSIDVANGPNCGSSPGKFTSGSQGYALSFDECLTSWIIGSFGALTFTVLNALVKALGIVGVFVGMLVAALLLIPAAIIQGIDAAGHYQGIWLGLWDPCILSKCQWGWRWLGAVGAPFIAANPVAKGY